MGFGRQICTASTDFKKESIDHFSSAGDNITMSPHHFEKSFFKRKSWVSFGNIIITWSSDFDKPLYLQFCVVHTKRSGGIPKLILKACTISFLNYIYIF